MTPFFTLRETFKLNNIWNVIHNTWHYTPKNKICKMYPNSSEFEILFKTMVAAKIVLYQAECPSPAIQLILRGQKFLDAGENT